MVDELDEEGMEETSPDEVYYERGMRFAKKNDYEKALKFFDKSIKANKRNLKSYYNKGTLLLKMERFWEALKVYDDSLKIDKKQIDVWSNRGKTLEKLGKFEDAISCFEEVLKLDSNSERALFFKAGVLGRVERFDEGEKTLERLLKINPGNKNAEEMKKIFLKRIKGGKKMPGEAQKSANEILDIFAPEKEIKKEEKTEKEKEDKEEMSKEKIVEKEKLEVKKIEKNKKYWTERGAKMMFTKRLEDARISFDEALKFGFDEKILQKKSVVCLKLNKMDEAILCYDKILEKSPNNSSVFSARGMLLEKMGKLDEALLSFDKSLKLGDEEALYERVRILKKMRDSEKLLKLTEEILKDKHDDLEMGIIKSSILNKLGRFEENIRFLKGFKMEGDEFLATNLGVALRENGEISNSIQVFDEILGKNDGNLSVLLEKAIALYGGGKIKECLQLAEKGEKLNANNLDILYLKGIALGKLNRIEESKDVFEALVWIEKKRGDFWYAIAATDSLLGNGEESLKSLKKSFEQNGRFKEFANKDEVFEGLKKDGKLV